MGAVRDQPGVPAMPESTVDGVPAIGPNIVKTGELQIRVHRRTFVEQFQKAIAIAERYGGYVQSSSTSGTKVRSGSIPTFISSIATTRGTVIDSST